MTVSLPAATTDLQGEGGKGIEHADSDLEGSEKGGSLRPTTRTGPVAGQGVTATAFLKNKPLGRLLVMAARRLKEAKAKEGDSIG